MFIEFMLTVTSKVTHKNAIVATVKITDAEGEPIVAAETMRRRADTIKDKLNAALEKLTGIIDPDTNFSLGCDKATGGNGHLQIPELSIPLPDGNIMLLRLDIDTMGYTPADQDINELVLETLEEVLEEIGDAWLEDDVPLDEMMAWHTKATVSIHEQLGLPALALVSAAAGGADNSESQIQHGRDAAIG